MIDFQSQYEQNKHTIQKLEIEQQLMWERAAKSSDPEEIMKAMSVWQDVQKREESKAKSHIFDPYDFATMGKYKEKFISPSYGMFRKMGQAPIINSIVGTRIEQVAAFSQFQSDKYSTGFVIRKKRRYYSEDEQKLTKQDKKIAGEITDFILNCGNINTSWHGDSFDDFLRKITKDSFELDQMTFEVVRNRKGLPVEFFATDGSTYRLADSIDDNKQTNRAEEINGYYPTYVQVIDGKIMSEFYPWELCFGIRNPQTNLRNHGYGHSELETLVSVVTWMLYSDAYNGKFFSQGSAPKGILKVMGNVNPNKLAEFRQQWQAMVSGVFNAWKVPILQSDQMEWIDLQKNNRDMEFSHWQEYLIKLTCAIYKIDPSEIGFPMQGSSDSKPLFEANNEAKLKYSKDKGLKPTLKFIESKINKFIVNPLNPEFEFIFVGVDSETEEKEVELAIKEMKYKGLKEVRRSRGLSDTIDKDDIILDPAWIQLEQMTQFGSPESNDVVDEENPEDDDFAFSKEGNPFVSELNSFVKSLR